MPTNHLYTVTAVKQVGILPMVETHFFYSLFNYTRDQYNDFTSNTRHMVKPILPMQQQRALSELSSNTNIVIMEADNGGAITNIINRADYVQDCNLILTDKCTFQDTTSCVMETHNEEAQDIIGSMSSNNRIHISQLFPVKATPGTFNALPKRH